MKNLLHLHRTLVCVAATAVLASGFLARQAGAQSFGYHVTLDASPLTTSDAGPFSLEFQLNAGIGPDASRTQVMLSDFAFGGGAPSGSPLLLGGASGDLSTGVLLQTSSFLNDFQQGFTPQGVLSFDLCLMSTPADPPRDPADGFSFAILDSLGFEIPTLGLFDIGSDVLINVDLTGYGTPTVLTYATDPSQPPAAGTTPIQMNAPIVTSTGAGCVPEPGPLALMAGSVIACWIFGLGRRSAPAYRA